MSDRTKPRTSTVARVAGTVGGITAGLATTVLMLVGGGDPAGAQPAPAPSPSVTTPQGLSVHLDLPGLLTVHLDVPPLTGLLGGRPAGAATTGSPASSTPRAVPTPSATERPVRTPTRTGEGRAAPARRETPRPRPNRVAGAAEGTGGFAGAGRTVRDTVAVRHAPKAVRTAHRKPVAESAEVFRPSLSPAAPVRLLVGVVALCALGTAAVVGLAGRKDRARV